MVSVIRRYELKAIVRPWKRSPKATNPFAGHCAVAYRNSPCTTLLGVSMIIRSSLALPEGTCEAPLLKLCSRMAWGRIAANSAGCGHFAHDRRNSGPAVRYFASVSGARNTRAWRRGLADCGSVDTHRGYDDRYSLRVGDHLSALQHVFGHFALDNWGVNSPHWPRRPISGRPSVRMEANRSGGLTILAIVVPSEIRVDRFLKSEISCLKREPRIHHLVAIGLELGICRHELCFTIDSSPIIRRLNTPARQSPGNQVRKHSEVTRQLPQGSPSRECY